jgi:hypothetical protein
MQLDGPTFIPKAALTAGRVLHQPFEVPTEMTKSALLQGGVTHDALGAVNKAAADAVAQLEPRGPAKLLEKLFGKVDGALVHSAGQAQRATEVFWVPFSSGAREVGHSVSNPFALFYAKRAGFDIPAEPADMQAMLAKITNPDPNSTKFPGLTWPAPGAAADPGGTDPGGETGGTDPGGTDPGADPGGTDPGGDTGGNPGGETGGETGGDADAAMIDPGAIDPGAVDPGPTPVTDAAAVAQMTDG